MVTQMLSAKLVLLLAHFTIRQLMAQAALPRSLRPTA